MMRLCLFTCFVFMGLTNNALLTNAKAEIAIGVAAPLSGLYASLGQQIVTGAEQAIDEINQAGGVLGQKLSLETIDDKCNVDNAEAVANQLVGKDVSFVIGHLCDRPSIQAANVYADNQIIQISPASQNPAFTDNRPNQEGGTYRFAARNTQQADVLVSFLVGIVQEGKIALLHDSSVYGTALFDAVSSGLEAANIKPVLSESFEPEQERYRVLSAKIVDSGARYVFIGGTHGDAARIIKELDTLTQNIQFIGGDGLVHADFPTLLLEENDRRATLDGIFVTFPPDPRQLDTAKNAVVRFNQNDIDPVGYTLRGYSAVKIIESALRRAEKTDFLTLIDAMNEGDFQTPLGSVSFDETGDADLTDYVVHRWEKRTIVPLDR